MPSYGFGSLQVVARQNLGSLGPAMGAPVAIHCPLSTALRTGSLWLILLILLLRKPNRNRQAWAVLLPSAALYIAVGVFEGCFTHLALFYTSLHTCLILCESLRTLAVALAMLLAISDRIVFRNHLLRFLAVFGFLLAAGAVANRLNTPVAGSTALLTASFGFFLLVFLVGHALLRAVLRWLAGCQELAWSAGAALVIAAAPLCALPIMAWLQSHPPVRLSTWVAFREAVSLSGAIAGPYFVLFWFLLLALMVPLYRQRLARSFGYDSAGPR